MDQTKIVIHTEYITLGQFLKFASIIDNGGAAKAFLAENRVLVNGEEDNRRGRKLRNGDTVVVLGKSYGIVG
ncbi:MAG: S4 domain-containing protein YaaA [Bacilli bacterium]|nr:S4 domain-containing protein YaaA [Bacilli bacterium]